MKSFISTKEFTNMSLNKRYAIIKEQGEYVGVRQLGNHRVHLYAVSNFFVEMWILFCINEIRWIEIQRNQSILNEYAEHIDLKKDLEI